MVIWKISNNKITKLKHALKSKIGYSKARKLAFAPHLILEFSLEANSPGWSSWQKNLVQTLKAGNIFGSEGLAINMSVYIENGNRIFTTYCNWITSVTLNMMKIEIRLLSHFYKF